MTTNSVATTGTQVVSDITVQSCAPATGRQGNAQWQISADVPWSKFPERFWVDAVAGSAPVAPGVHHCAFSVGAQKPNTTGQVAFHYRFRLDVIDYVGGAYPDVMALSFGSLNAPASVDTGAPVGAPMHHTSDRELSIIRQSSIKAVIEARIAAYNNATNLALNGLIQIEELSNQAEVMVHDIVGGMDLWVQQVVAIVLDPPMPPPEVPPIPAPVPTPPTQPAPAEQQPIFEETV